MVTFESEIRTTEDLRRVLPQLTFMPLSGPALTPFCPTDRTGVEVAYCKVVSGPNVDSTAVVLVHTDERGRYYQIHSYDTAGNCEVEHLDLPNEITNEDRAACARAALAAYVAVNGGTSGETETDAQDLIGDLLHLLREEVTADPGPIGMTPLKYLGFAVNGFTCEERGGERYAVTVEVYDAGRRELLSSAYV